MMHNIENVMTSLGFGLKFDVFPAFGWCVLELIDLYIEVFARQADVLKDNRTEV